MHLYERIEDHILLLSRYSTTSIGDTQEYAARRLSGTLAIRGTHRCVDHDAPPFAGELHGVRQQVEQDLLELLSVGVRPYRRLDTDLTADAPGAELRLHHRHDAAHHLGKRDVGHIVLDPSCLQLREVEHIINEREQMLLTPMDTLEGIVLGRCHRTV